MNRPRTNRMLVATGSILVLAATVVRADVPRAFTLQAKIANYEEIESTDLEIRFFDAKVGGTMLFEETHDAVALSGGVFAINVGIPSGGIGDEALDAAQVWMEITVDGNVQPRTLLLSVPFAFKSNAAETLVGPDSLDPVVEVTDTGVVVLRPLNGQADAEMAVEDTAGNTAVRLRADGQNAGPKLSLFKDDGTENVELIGENSAGGGLLLLRNGGTDTTVKLSADNANGGGRLLLFNGQGRESIKLSANDGSDNEFIEINHATATTRLGRRDGFASKIFLYQADGDTGIKAEGGNSGNGKLTVHNDAGEETVWLNGDFNGAGDGRVRANFVRADKEVNIYQDDGNIGVQAHGDVDGNGRVVVFNDDGTGTVWLNGDFNGAGDGRVIADFLKAEANVDVYDNVNVYQDDGDLAVKLEGDVNGSGRIYVTNDAGEGTVWLNGDFDGAGHGRVFTDYLRVEDDINVYQPDGDLAMQMDGDTQDLKVYQRDGQIGVNIQGDTNGGGHGRIYITNDAGEGTIWLSGDYDGNGNGKITTDVLRIEGGSDLAEPFVCRDHDQVEPGMVMSIDPDTPAALAIANKPYDTRVAGIVSGAGGVNPGITLSQDDRLGGDVLVAMTGRVYAWCDASYGAIAPGDRLTTSATAGHAMKSAQKGRKARGAIIGKAMSGLESGRGLVLVLVQPQ